MVLNLRTSELGGSGEIVEPVRGQLHRLAAHDERARKNGYEHKMRRIELVKRLADVLPRKVELRVLLYM